MKYSLKQMKYVWAKLVKFISLWVTMWQVCLYPHAMKHLPLCFMNVLGSYKTAPTRLTMVYLCDYQISKEHWQTTSNAEFAKFSILNQVNLKTTKTVKLNYSQNTGPLLQVHVWASSAVCQSLVIHQVSIMVYMYHKTHLQSHQL